MVTEPGGLRVRVLRPWARLRGHPAHPVNPALPAALTGADVVHAHHMRSAPSRVAAVASRIAGRPLAVTDHGLGGGGWWGLLPRLFDRFLLVSQFSATTLGTPPGRTAVVYGGTDTARYHPPPPGEEQTGVLFVGRLTPHKGVDLLIRAVPPDVPLTVVGTRGHDPQPPESAYPELLARLARGRRVRFVTRADDMEVAALYRQAAVVCLPSVHVTCYGRRVAISELLGLAAIESMASGTPVICSRLGGLAEVVRHGETGYLVEPGNVAELRDRIMTVLAAGGWPGASVTTPGSWHLSSSPGRLARNAAWPPIRPPGRGSRRRPWGTPRRATRASRPRPFRPRRPAFRTPSRQRPRR